MRTLVEFLTARLDEDAAVAMAASGRAPWSYNADDYWMITGADGDVVVYDESDPTAAEATHIVRHDPARVLADVAARRAILDEHKPQMWRTFVPGGWEDIPQCQVCADWEGGRSARFPCSTVRALLLPYADHPDFDPAWRTG